MVTFCRQNTLTKYVLRNSFTKSLESVRFLSFPAATASHFGPQGLTEIENEEQR